MKTESVKLPVKTTRCDYLEIIDAGGQFLTSNITTRLTDDQLRQIVTALNTQPQLLEACKELFGMVEAGTLVRDCSHDADPKWYLTAMELTSILAKAQSAIAAAELDRQEGKG